MLIFSIIFLTINIYMSGPFFYIGISLLTSIILLIIGEGFIGLIHIFSLMSNILSYLRLMAIGLSSVGIAIVINSIVTKVIFPKVVFLY